MAARKKKRGPGRPALGTKARQTPKTIRISEEDGTLFKDAAAVVDETVSTFLVTAGRERARRVLKK